MQKKYQIFVSSTYADLVQERQAAVEAILRCGHIPAGMELFSAGDESQLEVIKRWIDESDIYMLILGGRYGTIEPNLGLSYTEIEYEYAMSRSKPFFAVVLSDEAIERKVKDHGLAFIERVQPQKLAAFRTKVLSRISGFVEDVKDIKLHITNSINDLSKKYTLGGWVRNSSTSSLVPAVDVANAGASTHPPLRLVDSFPKEGQPIPKREMKRMYLKFNNPIDRTTGCYIGILQFRQNVFYQWDCHGGIQYAEGNTKLIWHMSDQFFQQEPEHISLDDECYRFELHIGRGHPDNCVKDIYGGKLPHVVIPVWICRG